MLRLKFFYIYPEGSEEAKKIKEESKKNTEILEKIGKEIKSDNMIEYWLESEDIYIE